ncbi:uncharacterized protein TNCV_1048581 [Trichonephila clavipes]|nr:uncharacterized protein TNCV_1048581 [Trichonephila clavipes]
MTFELFPIRICAGLESALSAPLKRKIKSSKMSDPFFNEPPKICLRGDRKKITGVGAASNKHESRGYSGLCRIPVFFSLPLAFWTPHFASLATVVEWYRYRIVAGFVTSSSPVPLKTHRVGQRCTLNLSRAESSSRWFGVVARRGDASSGVVHGT